MVKSVAGPPTVGIPGASAPTVVVEPAFLAEVHKAPGVGQLAIDLTRDGLPDIVLSGPDLNRTGLPDVIDWALSTQASRTPSRQQSRQPSPTTSHAPKQQAPQVVRAMSMPTRQGSGGMVQQEQVFYGATIYVPQRATIGSSSGAATTLNGASPKRSGSVERLFSNSPALIYLPTSSTATPSVQDTLSTTGATLVQTTAAPSPSASPPLSANLNSIPPVAPVSVSTVSSPGDKKTGLATPLSATLNSIAPIAPVSASAVSSPGAVASATGEKKKALTCPSSPMDSRRLVYVPEQSPVYSAEATFPTTWPSTMASSSTVRSASVSMSRSSVGRRLNASSPPVVQQAQNLNTLAFGSTSTTPAVSPSVSSAAPVGPVASYPVPNMRAEPVATVQSMTVLAPARMLSQSSQPAVVRQSSQSMSSMQAVNSVQTGELIADGQRAQGANVLPAMPPIPREDPEVGQLRGMLSERELQVEELQRMVDGLRDELEDAENRVNMQLSERDQQIAGQAQLIQELQQIGGAQGDPNMYPAWDDSELQRLRQTIEEQAIKIRELEHSRILTEQDFAEMQQHQMQQMQQMMQQQEQQMMQQPSNGAAMGVQFSSQQTGAQYGGPQTIHEYSSQQTGAQYGGPQTIPEYGEQPAEYLPEPLEVVPSRGDEGYAMVQSAAPGDRRGAFNLIGFNGRGDQIDRAMLEYFEGQPDFQVEVEKVKKGWYHFGPPIAQKVYMKVVGSQVVVRVGGGYTNLTRFLDEHRKLAIEAADLELSTQAVREKTKRKSARGGSHRGGRGSR